MLDTTNFVGITGGLTRDPEVFKDTVVRLGVAVSYAGTEDKKTTTGYFDVTVFLNGGDRNSDFIKKQIDDGKMKQGSQISVIGKLSHERWPGEDGKTNSRVRIIAESVTYASNGSRADDKEAKTVEDANHVSAVPEAW